MKTIYSLALVAMVACKKEKDNAITREPKVADQTVSTTNQGDLLHSNNK